MRREPHLGTMQLPEHSRIYGRNYQGYESHYSKTSTYDLA